MTVHFTDKKEYPIIVHGDKGKLYIHRFTLDDDDTWEDFITALNQYREGYLNNVIEKIAAAKR